MESSKEDSPQAGGRPASKNSLSPDLDTPSPCSSSSGSLEEQPCLVAARVKDWNPASRSTPKDCVIPHNTTKKLNYSTASREQQAKGQDTKASAQGKEPGDHKLTNLGLDYDSLSSDTDQQVCKKLWLKYMSVLANHAEIFFRLCDMKWWCN